MRKKTTDKQDRLRRAEAALLRAKKEHNSNPTPKTVKLILKKWAELKKIKAQYPELV